MCREDDEMTHITYEMIKEARDKFNERHVPDKEIYDHNYSYRYDAYFKAMVEFNDRQRK